MKIKIEVGKTYRTRTSGETVQIIDTVTDPNHYANGRFIGVYTNDGGHAYWTENGGWIEGTETWPYDLVEEV